jgi:serine/threonine protein phosphatase PrpC
MKAPSIHLSEPITAMVVEERVSKTWSASAASMQGWRRTHEDAHLISSTREGSQSSGIFAVFDGHGGKGAALKSREVFEELCVPLMDNCALDSKTAQDEFSKIFLNADERLRSELPIEDKSGTTVAAVVVTQTDSNYCIHMAHAGDSRILVCSGGELYASEDHKPGRADEMARILAAGGSVAPAPFNSPTMRIDGNLAVSRGLGDFQFKSLEQPRLSKVSPMPEVQTVSAAIGDWVLLACDGIFDVFSNVEVRDFIATRLCGNEVVDGGKVLTELFKRCLEKGSRDNCTATLIQLQHGGIVKSQERSLDVGGYYMTQNGEVLRSYRKFFRAEGFQVPARG